MIDLEKDQTDYYQFLKEIKRLSDNSIAVYWKYYKHIDPNNITEESVKNFIIKHGNIFTVRGFLKSYLLYRGLHKTIDLPPAPTGSLPQRIIRDISKEDIERLSRFLYSKSFKKGLLFDLVYQGALRRLEVPTIKINSFRWEEWIDNVDNFLKLIVIGKRKKERIVLINPLTAQKLLNYYMRRYQINDHNTLRSFFRSSSLIFIGKNKRPLTESQLYHIIKTNSMECLGRDIRPHELRHARATELEQLRIPIRDIKTYLGHSSIATTEIYLHKKEYESVDNIRKILNLDMIDRLDKTMKSEGSI